MIKMQLAEENYEVAKALLKNVYHDVTLQNRQQGKCLVSDDDEENHGQSQLLKLHGRRIFIDIVNKWQNVKCKDLWKTTI